METKIKTSRYDSPKIVEYGILSAQSPLCGSGDSSANGINDFELEEW